MMKTPRAVVNHKNKLNHQLLCDENGILITTEDGAFIVVGSPSNAANNSISIRKKSKHGIKYIKRR